MAFRGTNVQVDDALIEFAEQEGRQELAEKLRVVNESDGIRGAAKRLGVTHSGLATSIKRLKTRAAKQGYSPEHDMTHTVPDGYHVRGTSTLYDSDGNRKIQWVKSNLDHQRQTELLRESIAGLIEEAPRAIPSKPPKHQPDHLLNCYIITDYHLGMMAWGEETKDDDWDTTIAETLLMSWFDAAIDLAPPCKTGIFAQIGDMLHWDGMDAVTPASRHLLDADTRFQRLVRVAIRLMRHCIEKMREKHEIVHVIMADANHDPASEIWLRELLSAMYENEPRVIIDTNADTYYCYEHGLTSLFFHHGHKRKPTNIDDVFVAKYREVFGRTKHSYAHTGHLHHNFSKETNLMMVEQHRTLAAKDAYASRGGYMSGRDAKVITYHQEHGEVSRLTISPEMLKK